MRSKIVIRRFARCIQSLWQWCWTKQPTHLVGKVSLRVKRSSSQRAYVAVLGPEAIYSILTGVSGAFLRSVNISASTLTASAKQISSYLHLAACCLSPATIQSDGDIIVHHRLIVIVRAPQFSVERKYSQLHGQDTRPQVSRPVPACPRLRHGVEQTVDGRGRISRMTGLMGRRLHCMIHSWSRISMQLDR